MTTKAVVLIAITVILMVPPAEAASACGCGGLPADASEEVIKAAIAKEFNSARVVFSGEVVAQEYRSVERDDTGEESEAEVLVFKFAVERRWKGEAADQVILRTSTLRYADGGGSSNSCDFGFEVGKKYLVYAFGSDDELKTHACSRTASVEYAGRDIEELDKLDRIVGANGSRSRRRR